MICLDVSVIALLRPKKGSAVRCASDNPLQSAVRFLLGWLGNRWCSRVEISYGYRYAEKKPVKKGNPWVIRQSGIYHRHDLATGRSLYIVCSPVLRSAFEQRLFQLLNTSQFQMDVLANPLLFHHMFVSTHLGNLRNYALHFEQRLERIVSLRLNYCLCSCH